jgi:hypothetical protein
MITACKFSGVMRRRDEEEELEDDVELGEFELKKYLKEAYDSLDAGLANLARLAACFREDLWADRRQLKGDRWNGGGRCPDGTRTCGGLPSCVTEIRPCRAVLCTGFWRP